MVTPEALVEQRNRVVKKVIRGGRRSWPWLPHPEARGFPRNHSLTAQSFAWTSWGGRRALHLTKTPAPFVDESGEKRICFESKSANWLSYILRENLENVVRSDSQTKFERYRGTQEDPTMDRNSGHFSKTVRERKAETSSMGSGLVLDKNVRAGICFGDLFISICGPHLFPGRK